MAPEHAICWFEIPVSDLERARQFYDTVFKTTLEDMDMGPNPMAVFPRKESSGIGGHLYEGRPAVDCGSTVHLVVPDAKLEDALARVEPAGGKVVSEPIEIPAGRFAYCTDPDGNSIGLFGA